MIEYAVLLAAVLLIVLGTQVNRAADHVEDSMH